MNKHQVNSISLYTPQAQSFIDLAAAELRDSAMAMVRDLPDVMQVSCKAANAYIKHTFVECDFLFAMFVQKNKHKPRWLELGISVMTSLMPLEVTNFIICRPKNELIEYIEHEYTNKQCAHDLKQMMESLYDEIKSNYIHDSD